MEAPQLIRRTSGSKSGAKSSGPTSSFEGSGSISGRIILTFHSSIQPFSILQGKDSSEKILDGVNLIR